MLVDPLMEYIGLLLRWLHVVAAIAWIGESIYFVMLDNSLKSPRSPKATQAGVSGEMWAVHGGGFYHNQKYLTSPAELPGDLHWSYVKSYTTWLSGFALLAILYLLQPDLYLRHTGGGWEWAAQLPGWLASTLAVGLLIAGWLAYDQLCRRISPNMEHDGRLSVAVAILMIAIAWLSTQLFQGRAAFLLTGAVMATCMSANVYFWIIPGQQRMVAAMKSGRAVNPLDGKRGKQRSVHNTYFTLPVVLLMLSNHYAFTYNSPHAWVIMSLFILGGAAIRQYFVLRHLGQNRYIYPIVGIACVIAIGVLVSLGAQDIGKQQPGQVHPQGSSGVTSLTHVQSIIDARCTQCHSSRPTQAGFAAAPLGIQLDRSEDVLRYALQIKATVGTKYMPLGNITEMTDDERGVIAAWQP